MWHVILVIITVLLVLVILAFTGVQPFSDFKNKIVSNIGDIFQETEPTTIYDASTQEGQVIIPEEDNSVTLTPITTTSSATTTPPAEVTTIYVPSFLITDIISDATPYQIKAGYVTQCKITVYLKATEANKPGYYTIELVSKYIQSYGTQEIRYVRGNEVNPLSWTVSGGETWLAMGRGESLRVLFDCMYSYLPFEPVTPFFKGTPPTTIENALFGMINNQRAKVGIASLKWEQSIQDDARLNAMNMLVEGVSLASSLQPPYEAQIVFSGSVHSGETPEMIAKKAFDSWLSSNPDRLKLIEADYKLMAVGYVEENREHIYYIDVLFSK